MRGVKLFFKKGIKNFLLCSRLRFFITSHSLCALGVCVCVISFNHRPCKHRNFIPGSHPFLRWPAERRQHLKVDSLCGRCQKKGALIPFPFFPLFPSPFDVCCAGYKNRRKRRSPSLAHSGPLRLTTHTPEEAEVKLTYIP